MRSAHRLRSWLRAVLDRKRFEAHMNDEMRFHIETRADDLMARDGIQRDEALRRARLEFGSAEKYREHSREARGLRYWDEFRSDARYAFRQFRRSPAFTATAILTLGLGIGGNAAMFSFIDISLIRPLPYREPEQLVRIEETNLTEDIGGSNVSYPNLRDWKARSHSFDDIAGMSAATLNLSGVEEAERLSGATVTSNYFSVLGLTPILGSTFSTGQTRPDDNQVTLLSESLWNRRFGADRNILGQSIRLNAQTYTVMGVVPADPLNPRIDLWIPMAMGATTERRSNHFINTVGRLKPNADVTQAETELNSIAEMLEAEYPETNKGWRVDLTPLHEDAVGNVRPGLIVLMSAVGFVLLLACANLANLQLGRASNRQQEIAIRTAIGSGRPRLVRQILTESILISLLGGLAGVASGAAAISLMRSNLAASFPRMADATLDLRVLGFTLGLSLLTGIASGLLPALQSSSADFHEALRTGNTKTALRRSQRLQNVLTVAEISISMVLLAGAALLIASFARMRSIDLGFEPHNTVTFRLSVPGSRYPRGPAVTSFFQNAIERLKTIPGVTSVGALSSVPLAGPNLGRGYMREGDPVPSRSDARIASYTMMTPGLLPAIGMRLREGREFEEADAAGNVPVAIINRTLARTLWPNESAVGHQIRVYTDENFPRTVVGVVDDIKQRSLLRTAPHILVPHAQDPVTSMTLVLRTTRDPASVIAAVRTEIRSLDSDIPAWDIMTMDQRIAAFTAPQRSATQILTVFALVALVLALTGIYGVISYFVSQRTREFGIRMALGARRWSIMRFVIQRAAILVATGLLLGTAGAIGLSRFVAGLLFGANSIEPGVLAIVAALLTVVALAAVYFPARRATKVDPIVALKVE